jgi:hypothetical protein
MDISCRVYKTVTKYLILMQIIWFEQQLGTDLGIVREISVLTSEFVLMPRYFSEKLPSTRIHNVSEGFLFSSGLQEHKNVSHTDGFFMLLL